MKVAFVTTNKHKFEEVQHILAPYPIELEQVVMEYEENHDSSLEEIAKNAAKKVAASLEHPVIVEDTGLFFAAYPGFPGALPKFVFNTLGYEGIFRLLAGKSRSAYFKTVAALCEPKGKPALFEGSMQGSITEVVHDADKDVMPYDRIFIPEGESQPISAMTLEKKNSFSQRAQAFRKFGEYLLAVRDDATGVPQSARNVSEHGLGVQKRQDPEQR